tara:strand:+ start:264 stop:1256 length:993 start_codon:yes stop_codon:yes gene_type:complete
MNPEGKKVDAILLAGEGESSFKVYNRHKAFLKINGKCIISYVLEALQMTESVRAIYLVGLKDKVTQALEESGIDMNYPKPLHIVQQRANLYENIWYTFLRTLAPEGEEPDLTSSDNLDKAALIVPCDAPLITPHEVEYFISHADEENFDHVLGLSSRESLQPFYPRDGLPGIRMAYLHLKENKYRINNLHLVKPLRIGNRQYIQKMYQYRYQRNIKNMFLFGLSLIGKDNPVNLKYYFGLQLGLLFSKCKLEKLAKYFRGWTPKKDFENRISHILKTRFTALETPFPGAALDIDNDRDYEVIRTRFEEWRCYLESLNQKHPLPARSESMV